MAVAKIRTAAISLQPMNPQLAPVGSIFQSNQSSNPIQMATVGGGSSDLVQSGVSFIIKTKQSATSIAISKPVSLLSTGLIVPTDSDDAQGQQPIGIALTPFEQDGLGTVLLVGANVPDVIAGMGFHPGDEVFVNGSSGGFTNDPSTLRIGIDQIIKMGIADCPNGEGKHEATDLILVLQILART